MPNEKCPECNGTGQKRWKHRESKHHSSGMVTICPACFGSGKTSRYVQAQNLSTGKWVKIDTERGRIVANKKTPGPYKNIPKYNEKGDDGNAET